MSTVTSLPFTDEDLRGTIAQRFRKVAAAFPDSLALQTRERSCTYRELDEATDRVATAILHRRGFASEPIAVSAADHIDLAIAMFGTLKAGRFYVVLDGMQPRQRLQAIVDHAQPALLLRSTEAVGGFGIDEIAIEEALDTTADPQLLGGVTVPTPAPLHIVYTSGTTGRPKGVVQHQISQLHYAKLNIELDSFRPDDRSIMLSASGTALGAIDILVPLQIGAAGLAFSVAREGFTRLAAFLLEEHITVFNSQASFFRHLMSSVDESLVFPFRYVTLMSEVVYWTDFAAFLRHTPDDAKFCVGFGSTEAGMVSVNLADHRTPVDTGVFPIGYPTEDVILIDENGGEVPRGETGEIVKRTRTWSTTYWRDPEQAAARYARDANDPSLLVIRTGDVGRFREDGCLLHLGRIDDQVKIHGLRVEPAEIESALLRCEGVSEAAVVAVAASMGEKRLVAYVGAHDAVDPATLRRALAADLPAVMIPSEFIVLPELPMNSNNKVDRVGLRDRIEKAQPAVAGRAGDELAEMIRATFEEVLERPVGPDDHFFEDHGGSSLRAASAFARIERELGCTLPLPLLLEASTANALADAIRREIGERFRSPVVPINPNGRRPALFCVSGEGGNVIGFRELSQELGADQPFYGLQSLVMTGEAETMTSFEGAAKRYAGAMRTVQPWGPYVVGGYSVGGRIAFEIARHLINQGEEVAALLIFDTPGDTPKASLVKRAVNRAAQLRRDPAMRIPGYAREVQRRLRRWHLRHRPVDAGSTTEETAIRLAAAWREHKLQPVDTRIIVFRAEHGVHGTVADRDLGWGPLAKRGVEIRDVPGDHDTMLFAPHVRKLAAELRDAVDGVMAGSVAS